MRAGIAAALLVLAGCDAIGGDRGNGTAPVNPPAGNDSASAPAPPTVPETLSPLVGRWADVGSSCARPVEIFDNGTFRAVDGSRGHWRYEGDRLTINVGARVFRFQVLSLTRDRIETVDAQGQRGASVRCP